MRVATPAAASLMWSSATSHGLEPGGIDGASGWRERTRRHGAHVGLHEGLSRPRIPACAPIEQPPQHGLPRARTRAGSHLEQAHVVDIRPAPMAGGERVRGPAECRGRKQPGLIARPGKGAGLAHQRPHQMPVVNGGLPAPPQPVDRRDRVTGLPDLQAFGIDPHLHGFANEPRGTGVDSRPDPNHRDAMAQHPAHAAILKPQGWEGVPVRPCVLEPRLASSIPSGKDGPQTLRLGGLALDIALAPEPQGVLDGPLEPGRGLFPIAMFMATTGRVRIRPHPIVRQHLPSPAR